MVSGTCFPRGVPVQPDYRHFLPDPDALRQGQVTYINTAAVADKSQFVCPFDPVRQPDGQAFVAERETRGIEDLADTGLKAVLLIAHSIPEAGRDLFLFQDRAVYYPKVPAGIHGPSFPAEPYVKFSCPVRLPELDIADAVKGDGRMDIDRFFGRCCSGSGN